MAATDPVRTAYDACMALEVGDKAPVFTLVDQSGEKVKLSGFKGRKVLVYFYPKADTPGCTTQACGLRDILGDIGDTAVLGISPDAPTKQAKFDQKYGLGFPLLADEDHAVAEAYDVWAEKSMYGRKYMGIVRSAFLIDEKGKLEGVWYKVSPKDTPSNLLAALGKKG
jgi:peroxiredoxin Q/BCP